MWYEAKSLSGVNPLRAFKEHYNVVRWDTGGEKIHHYDKETAGGQNQIVFRSSLHYDSGLVDQWKPSQMSAGLGSFHTAQQTVQTHL